MAKPSAVTVVAGCAGLVAGTLAFGAVQLALGNDLRSGSDRTEGARSAVTQQHNVNRTGKGDRLAPAPASSTGSTLSFRTPGVPDTLIVTRVPSAEGSVVKPDSMLRSIGRAKPAKRTVACEPAVSVLTEVAKLLDSSRCIT